MNNQSDLNASSDAAAAPIVAAYFPEWGIYGRDYTISDVPADKLTHLIYAFAKIDESGRMALFDNFAATDKAFSAEDSVDGIADSWTDQDLRGNFNQIAELKDAYPHLKTSIAVGGWTLSGPFSDIAATEAGRETFAQSAIEFLRTYEMFDGIDFDWEYPGGGGLSGNSVRPEDGENYAKLLELVREKLDALEVETGRDYEISVASPAGYEKIANFNLEGLAPSVDFFNLMAYDFHGGWESTTGHQAPIFDTTGGQLDIVTAVDLYRAAGVPSEKIILGAPMYTRAWAGVADGGDGGWNEAASGTAPGSFEAGVYDYKDLLAQLQAPDSPWTLYYDDNSQAAYLYNANEGIFSSIETPSSIALKSEWAQAEGLGGMMFWDLSNDATGDPESLLTAGFRSWIEGMTFEEISALSTLHPEIVIGGDGVVQPIAEADTPSTSLPGSETDPTTDTGDDTEEGTNQDTGSDEETSEDTGTNPETGGTTGEAAQTVEINWAWGSHVTLTGFDPASDIISIAWIGADALEISESDNGLIIAIPTNNQSTTLAGISLENLTAANFSTLDATAEAEILALLSQTNDDHTDHGDMAQMIMISLDGSDRIVDDFNPTIDMIHVEPGVTGPRFEIFEESGDALGQTVRLVVSDANGTALNTTILQNVSLTDLSLGNFSIAEESVLNEVVAAIGETIGVPTAGGYTLTYDNDGSNPAETLGSTSAGGIVYKADPNADDIVGFNPATDQLEFGGTSVHGLILTKSPAGEIVIDSPWSDAAQIVRGVGFSDIAVGSLGIVGNEHLRQDIGGVLSWEQGVGPREPDTVYIRSHEYGVSETVAGFDPETMKLSFLFFGTRERLSVEDTAEGLKIQSLPTGQSVILTDIQLADLSPGQVEFHFDQVMEDNLEAAFGFSQDDVTLVDRTSLLTPLAPDGATTDGHQVRDGVFNQTDPTDNDSDPGTGTDGPTDSGENDADPSDSPDLYGLTWNWGAQEVITDFDTTEDIIDFGNLPASQVAISESGNDLVIEILGNGGHSYTFAGLQAEDLQSGNITAPGYNDVLMTEGGVVDQLRELGYVPTLI